MSALFTAAPHTRFLLLVATTEVSCPLGQRKRKSPFGGPHSVFQDLDSALYLISPRRLKTDANFHRRQSLLNRGKGRLQPGDDLSIHGAGQPVRHPLKAPVQFPGQSYVDPLISIVRLAHSGTIHRNCAFAIDTTIVSRHSAFVTQFLCMKGVKMPPEPMARFTLNLPWALCESLDRRAERNRRSRTQELIVILEDCIGVQSGEPTTREASQA